MSYLSIARYLCFAGTAVLAPIGYTNAAPAGAAGIIAGCRVKPDSFAKSLDSTRALSIEDVDCDDLTGAKSLKFDYKSPVATRNPQGLFDVRFICTSESDALRFHSEHAMQEVFVRIDESFFGPMLAAPLQSPSQCGRFSGFNEGEKNSFCNSIHLASSGQLKCE